MLSSHVCTLYRNVMACGRFLAFMSTQAQTQINHSLDVTQSSFREAFIVPCAECMSWWTAAENNGKLHQYPRLVVRIYPTQLSKTIFQRFHLQFRVAGSFVQVPRCTVHVCQQFPFFQHCGNKLKQVVCQAFQHCVHPIHGCCESKPVRVSSKINIVERTFGLVHCMTNIC